MWRRCYIHNCRQKCWNVLCEGCYQAGMESARERASAQEQAGGRADPAIAPLAAGPGFMGCFMDVLRGLGLSSRPTQL